MLKTYNEKIYGEMRQRRLKTFSKVSFLRRMNFY